jgi:hypothetical protein
MAEFFSGSFFSASDGTTRMASSHSAVEALN